MTCAVNAELLNVMVPELELLLPALDEKGRRLVLGAVARAAGEGGAGAVARMTGASWQTVADGAAELGSGGTAPPGRVRRPGGGRKKLAVTDPGLLPALLGLVADSTRGDPESPLRWTTRSLRHLAEALTGQGHPCSPQTVRSKPGLRHAESAGQTKRWFQVQPQAAYDALNIVSMCHWRKSVFGWSPRRSGSDDLAFLRIEILAIAELGAQPATDPQPVPSVHAQVAKVKHAVHVRPEQQPVV